MKLNFRILVAVVGAIMLLTLGGLTIFGPVPEWIGLPLLLVAAIAYGMEFERGFWIAFGFAGAMIFVYLGFHLYPNYATEPKILTSYVLVALLVTAAFAWVSIGNIRKIDAEEKTLLDSVLDGRRKKREKKDYERAARELIEAKSIVPRAGEPLPPWLQFPGYKFFGSAERFGAYGPKEEYRDKVWWPYWSDLKINQRHEYFQYYDLGTSWPDREDWYDYYVVWERAEVYEQYLQRLVEEAEVQTQPGEAVPPWIKHPELADAASDWRDGIGETYLKQTFMPFFNALTVAEKVDYLRRHDLGLGWDDRDEWMWLIGYEADFSQPR